MAAKKKSTKKKSTSKRSTAKRSTAKKSTARRSTAKRTTASRAGGKKKAPAKRTTARSSKAKTRKAPSRAAAKPASRPRASAASPLGGGRPVARPAETPLMPSVGMETGMAGESGFGSEGESSSSLGGGSSERIKIGERPPEQTWPGGGNR